VKAKYPHKSNNQHKKEEIFVSDPVNLDYAAPQRGRKPIRPLVRELIGIVAIAFLTPTINIIAGKDDDGPVSKVAGIVVTLSISFALGFVSFTGRFRIRRN
jgi:hypothetical protein